MKKEPKYVEIEKDSHDWLLEDVHLTSFSKKRLLKRLELFPWGTNSRQTKFNHEGIQLWPSEIKKLKMIYLKFSNSFMKIWRKITLIYPQAGFLQVPHLPKGDIVVRILKFPSPPHPLPPTPNNNAKQIYINVYFLTLLYSLAMGPDPVKQAKLYSARSYLNKC